jgi:uncharacterized protein
MVSCQNSSRSVPSLKRLLAPDLIRGIMLLFIALANSAVFAVQGQPGLDTDPDTADRVVNALLTIFVDARAYPVFAVMFGYGMVQIFTRQRASGATLAEARRVLYRRNAWLIVLGFAHASLLNFGDFLGAYGIVGIFSTMLLVNAHPRTDKWIIGIWVVTIAWLAVLGIATSIGAAADSGVLAEIPVTPQPSLAATTYGASILLRLTEWPIHTLTVLPFILIVWLGICAGRRELIEKAAQHRRLLCWIAITCLGITFAGAVPMALLTARLIPFDAEAGEAMLRLQEASGMFGGPGYVALFALLTAGKTASGLAAPLAALGRRSLTFYLVQSLAWVALLSPLGLELARGTSSPGIISATVAIFTWATTVAAALALEKRGLKGPAETVLGYLTYGRRSSNNTNSISGPFSGRP